MVWPGQIHSALGQCLFRIFCVKLGILKGMLSISKRNWSLNHTISCNGVTDSTNREGRNARTDSTL